MFAVPEGPSEAKIPITVRRIHLIRRLLERLSAQKNGIFVTVAVTRVLLNRRLSSASGRRHPPWGVPRFLILEAKAS